MMCGMPIRLAAPARTVLDAATLAVVRLPGGARLAAAGYPYRSRLLDALSPVRTDRPVRVGGLTLHLDGLDPQDGQLRRIVHSDHERTSRRLLAGLVRPGDTCVDVGAHVGLYALTLADRLRALGGRGRVHAFEAAPENAALLRRNVAANGLAGLVDVVEAAVTDRVGSASLVRGFNSGMHSTLPTPAATGVVDTVRATTLDAALPEPGTGAGLVVKIDVEGAEGAVLRGAERLLGSAAEVVLLVEYFPDLTRAVGADPGEILDLARRHGLAGVVVDDPRGWAPLPELGAVLRAREERSRALGRPADTVHEAVNLLLARGRPLPPAGRDRRGG